MVSYSDKRKIGDLLLVLLNDNDFAIYSDKINEKTIKYTEDLLARLVFCNQATTALFAGIKCIPKSTNVYGWLLSCGSSVLDSRAIGCSISHRFYREYGVKRFIQFRDRLKRFTDFAVDFHIVQFRF